MNLDSSLKQIDSRSLALATAGGALLILAALVLYLLMPEVKRYLAAKDTLTLLESSPGQGQEIGIQISQIRQEIDALEKEIHGDTAQLPAKQLESHIIESLQNISWHNQMQLTSLVPRKGNRIDMFQELIFDIELNGLYMDFFSWVSELHKQLGFVVISQFNIRPVNAQDENTRVQIKLTMIAYKADR